MRHHTRLNAFPLKKLIGFIFLFTACSSGPVEKKMNTSALHQQFYNKIGIGPVSAISIPDTIDKQLVITGDSLFKLKCITCHELSDVRKIGPGLENVTRRRRPEWILNQMLNPMEMTQKDSLAKELLATYLTQMTDMDLSQQDARALLEFLRNNDLK